MPVTQTATRTLTITVEINVVGLDVITASLPPATVGQPYSVQLEASGGSGPYTWSASGLPAGLTCSPAGVVSGTPSASGSFSVVVSVTDTGA